LKKSIVAFKKVEDEPGLANSYSKRTAFNQYFSLVADINEYEKENFKEFNAKGTFIVNKELKKNILRLEYNDTAIGRLKKIFFSEK
jgi:dynein heavy chain, axonemal